ncbi:MAG TPA: DUF2625 domain-containing protein [Flavisolibacter sp.]|jgi:hypothetical protein|nr:DUF2625 domain-containing protein [Flavisolibacter sp.]
MYKLTATLLLVLSSYFSFSQNQMRPLEQLTYTTEPGWPIVQEWISKARNKVEVLPCDSSKAREALYKTQVTLRSSMGAIIYSTGGILIDGGWIRILGSGSAKLNRSLPDWNKGKSFKEFGDSPPFILVADDAAGGFFAINGGGLGDDRGKLYYLSADNLEWQPFNMSYSDFLSFCFNGDIAAFYKDLRWKDWKNDLTKLDGNQTFSFYPHLWTREGMDINKASRKVINVEEEFTFLIDARNELGLSVNGF